MDWIKVKTRHVLFEYTDLSDSEFRAWIKLMAMVSSLEHEPTREQMLTQCHHKTLDSLQGKLKKHSTTLQEVFIKVLKDVQRVVKTKEINKERQQRFRDNRIEVTRDVTVMSQRREDKIREDKNKEKKRKEKIAFVLPEWIDSKTWDAFIEMRKSLHAPLTDHSKNLIAKELEKLKAQGHAPNDVLNQSIVRSWRGVFPIRQEGQDAATRANPYRRDFGRQPAELPGDVQTAIDALNRRRASKDQGPPDGSDTGDAG